MKKLVWGSKTEPNICLKEIMDKNIEEININGIGEFLANDNFYIIEEIKKMIFLKKIDSNFEEIKIKIFEKVLKKIKSGKYTNKNILYILLLYMINIYLIKMNFSNKEKEDIKNFIKYMKEKKNSKDIEESIDVDFKFLVNFITFENFIEILGEFLVFSSSEGEKQNE